MDRKAFLAAVGSYLLWGFLPLYWALISGVDAIFLLAARIFFSSIFTGAVLLGTKHMKDAVNILKNKRTLRYLLPAAMCVTLNWGIYIWAMANNRVMDASLGYYMNPLAVFLCGVLLFKERCGRLELVSLLLALTGVLISTIQFGAFPFAAVTLAVSFAAYGSLKKKAAVGGTASVFVETLLFAPFALLFLLFSPASAGVFDNLTPLTALLIACTGIVSASPLMLYGYGVTRLPFITMGFLHYICPTGMFISGLLLGEPFSTGQAVSFGFIWAGLILFTTGMIRQEKKRRADAKQSV